MKETIIGSQVWMTENLSVDNFCNGDSIYHAQTIQDWEQAGKTAKPAWCYYGHEPNNGKKYGKLYNWYAVNDPRGLAPQGWHVPSSLEWAQLSKFLGGDMIAGKMLKNTSGWSYNSKEANGTNQYGFSALPGGSLSVAFGFENLGRYGCWWSSTEKKDAKNWLGAPMPIVAYTFSINAIKFWGGIDDRFKKSYHNLENGYSVRCIKSN